jgi:hypothetical protein
LSSSGDFEIGSTQACWRPHMIKPPINHPKSVFLKMR